jgi:hypothetical protein
MHDAGGYRMLDSPGPESAPRVKKLYLTVVHSRFRWPSTERSARVLQHPSRTSMEDKRQLLCNMASV